MALSLHYIILYIQWILHIQRKSANNGPITKNIEQIVFIVDKLDGAFT